MITVHWTYFIEVACAVIAIAVFAYDLGAQKNEELLDWYKDYVEKMAGNLNKLWVENQELKKTNN